MKQKLKKQIIIMIMLCIILFISILVYIKTNNTSAKDNCENSEYKDVNALEGIEINKAGIIDLNLESYLNRELNRKEIRELVKIMNENNIESNVKQSIEISSTMKSAEAEYNADGYIYKITIK